MDSVDKVEGNLHQVVAKEASIHLGQTINTSHVQPIMTQPAVTHEEVQAPNHETPFQDLRGDLSDPTTRVANNPDILKSLRKRVASLLGSDNKEAA